MSELVFNFNGKQIRHGDPTIVCGIVNVTPDSFSDGGEWYGTEKAVNHAMDLINHGCTMIDLGGESTRPGSSYVEIEEEINRVVPVIKELKQRTDVPISIDTWKADVAKAAIEAGADIVNDITGLLGDPKMAAVIAESNAGAIVMFNPVIARPNHPGSKIFPSFGAADVFSEAELVTFEKMDEIELMKHYFEKTIAYAQAAGLSKDRIQLDPGIGFGLTKKENLNLIKHINVIHDWGYTCFLGVSRKRFVQNILNDAGFNTDTNTEEGYILRELGSTALTAIASFMGVEVVRVHASTEHAVAAIVGDAVRLAENMDDVNFGAYQK